MLKTLLTALAMAVGLAGATPALALRATVSQVDKDADGSMTCHFVGDLLLFVKWHGSFLP